MRNFVVGVSMAATLALGGVAYAITPGGSGPILDPSPELPPHPTSLLFGDGEATSVLHPEVLGVGRVVPTEPEPPDVAPVEPEPTAIPTVRVEPTPLPTARVEPTPIPTVTVEPTAIPTATVEPTPIPTVEPPGYGAVTLQGDVSINGYSFLYDQLIGVVWDVEDPSKVQLWTVWNDEPVLVCDGVVYELAGEPVYHADSQLLGPTGRCHGQRVPDGGDGVVLFIAFSDGQWVAATLTNPDGVPTADIFD